MWRDVHVNTRRPKPNFKREVLRRFGCSSSLCLVSLLTRKPKLRAPCLPVCTGLRPEAHGPLDVPTVDRVRPPRCASRGASHGASGCVYPSCCRGRGKHIVRALSTDRTTTAHFISLKFERAKRLKNDFVRHRLGGRRGSSGRMAECRIAGGPYNVLIYCYCLFGRNHESPSALSCMHSTVGVVSQPAEPAAFDSAARRHIESAYSPGLSTGQLGL